MNTYADFWALVDIRDQRECWEWQGARDKHGYGIPPSYIQIAFGEPLAHRIACTIARGQNKDLHVLHSCDNPRCCNPRHLRWGTVEDNCEDKRLSAWAKGAAVAREAGHLIPESWNYAPKEQSPRKRGQIKVSPEGVRAVRADYAAGMSIRAIAEKHGLTCSHADSIAKRRLWKHVPDLAA